MRREKHLAGFREGGLVFEHYRIARELGRGGAGAVYEVHDERSNQDVALKVLSPRWEQTDTDELRFRREFQTLVRLRHPRVVEPYDYGVFGAHCFYTMELLPGDDLRNAKDLGLLDIAALLRDVASALAMLHSRRLVHRDISVRNVRRGPDGTGKLIDFGLLASSGELTREVAGTPPFIAPEVLFGAAVDPRADLFSLGAVAYYMLCGRHAFPSRSLEERLRQLPAAPPTPPDEIRSDLTADLSELVMSLLAADRKARPATAAEVIERLEAAVSLNPVPELETAHAYVQSAELVGRDDEMRELRSRLHAAQRGHGCALVVRGQSGMGKSRLLEELALEAKTQGAKVIRIESQVHGGGPFDGFRSAVEEFRRELPEEAAKAFEAHRAHLAEVIADRGDVSIEKPASAADPRERRLELMHHATEWVLRMAEHQTVVLMIDDIQRCDEASASIFLGVAAGAKSRSLLVMAAQRLGEDVAAPDVLAAFEGVSRILDVEGMEQPAVEALVRSVFGDIDAAPTLARFVLRHTGGSPFLATELMQSLVDRGAIGYEAGLWTVQAPLEELRVPQSMTESMDARIAALDELAVKLAEHMAVHGGDVPFERCVRLVQEELDEFQTFEAIDRLVESEVVVGSGEALRFRHDGIREAVLRSIDADRIRALHMRVATTLSGSLRPTEPGRLGWHLVHAGQELDGAELLERAAREHFERTSFGDAARALRVVVDVYAQHEVHLARLPELYYMLASSGFFTDRALARETLPLAINHLGHHAGVSRMRRLQRFVGSRAGIVFVIAGRLLRHRFANPARRGMSPILALRFFARCVVYAGLLALAETERSRVFALREHLTPFRRFHRRNLSQVVRLFDMVTQLTLGRVGEVRAIAAELIEAHDEGSYRTVFEARLFLGAVRLICGLAQTQVSTDATLANIEALEGSGLRMFQLAARQLQQNYHLRRGEEGVAKEIFKKLEVEYARLGSFWQLELGLMPPLAMARGLIGDVVGLRRSIEHIHRLLGERRVNLSVYWLCRAEHARERGKFDDVLRFCDRADGLMPAADEGFGRAWMETCRADAFLANSQLDEAQSRVDAALAFLSEDAHFDAGYYLRARRIGALIKLARGNGSGAVADLEQALLETAASQNPAYLGMLHETRALVAHRLGDVASYKSHLAAADRWFRSTDNPALIRRGERLARLDVATREMDEDHVDDPLDTIRSQLSQCGNVIDRVHRALEILVEESQAEGGFLFMVSDPDMQLVAPATDEPPRGLRSMLERAVDRGLGWQETHVEGDSQFRALVLRRDQSLNTEAVAVAALKAGEGPLEPPDLRLVGEVASALAGDEPDPHLEETFAATATIGETQASPVVTEVTQAASVPPRGSTHSASPGSPSPRDSDPA